MEALNQEEMKEELLRLTESRLHVYAVLSQFFETEVTDAYARDFASTFDFECTSDELNNTFTQMRECLTDCDDHDIEELAVVFDRVFFGMGPRTAHKAFPYESVYTSVGGRMNQEAWTQVKAIYAKAGFEKNPSFKEPEDHIAVELSFMAEICNQVIDALKADNMQAAEALLHCQHQFMQDHIINWLNPFYADVQKATNNEGFYLLLMTATYLFIELDQDILLELIS